MNARELTLHIAANLGRIARWALEGRMARVEQFLDDTRHYLHELEAEPKHPRFEKTWELFKQQFEELRQDTVRDEAWADTVATWANILTHRATLAATSE